MSLDPDRLGRDSCARGFVRAAQCFANVLTGADVLAESRAILRGAFAPEVVCFGQDLPDLAGCSVPDADRELVRRAVGQVLRTGFMAIESSGGEPSMAYAVLPVSARGRTETALVIGYQGERSLPSHVLDALLAVAGLVGATMARQRTDRELQRLSLQARAILDSVGDGLYGVDREGRIAFVNPAAAELLGYEPEELLGAESHGVFHHTRADGTPYPLEECPVHRAFREERACSLEDVYWRKDGSPLQVECISTPVRESGGITGAVVAFREIAERKRAEAALRAAEEEVRRLNADLERRVAERTAELAASNAELEAFARSVAHDLRSPLRAVAGFSQAVMQDYAGRLDARGKKYLQMAVDGSQRMGRLIDALLWLSRVTRVEMVREPVDLGAMAREIEADLRRAEPERPVELEIGSDLLADGDPDLLRIVLMNLMRNAWKFTSRRPAAHVRVGRTRSRGRTAFFVSDDGVGFDMAFVEGHLVRPFRRLHSAHEFPGNGLGLATADRIVRRHGGEIWVHGEVGRGATIYFTLTSPGGTHGEQDHPARRGRAGGRDVDESCIQGEQGRE